MAFHFTLEVLLRYRQSLEDTEHLHLRARFAEQAALLHELRRTADSRLAFETAIGDALRATPVPAAEVRSSAARLTGIAHQQELLQQQLQQVRARIAQQTERYWRARQRRETLQSLRNRQVGEYRLQQRRRDQAAIDEIHLLRAHRRWA